MPEDTNSTSKEKNCTRKSGRLKNGNYLPPNPSSLRRSERIRSTYNSDSTTSGRRVVPCTRSNSGGCRKKIPVADEDDLREEGGFGEDFADRTSKSDKGAAGETPIQNVLEEAAGETPIQNNLELLSRLNPLNGSIEGSDTCPKRVVVHLPETNLFQDTCAEQKDLHQTLKPDMDRLFQILNLKEDVQQIAEQFLAYTIANQRVIRQSDQLQAFLISVCWVAASIMKENIDHVKSLSLARELLNFNCKTDDAEFSFAKMQFHMKMFMQSEAAKLQSNCKQKLIHEGFKIESAMVEEKKYEILWCESKAKLEDKFKIESTVIRSVNRIEAICIDKLKVLEANHRKKLEELELEMHGCLNSLKAKQRDEREAREAEVREGFHKMDEWKSWDENASELLTEAAEVVPRKRCSSSENDPEVENCKEHGSIGAHVLLLHAPEEPHTDVVEDSNGDEVAVNYDDVKIDVHSFDGYISKSKSTIQINNEARLFGNVGKRAEDCSGVQELQFASVATTEEVEQEAKSTTEEVEHEEVEQEMNSMDEVRVKKRKKPSLSIKEISKYFNMTQIDAAQDLNIGLSSFKEICKGLGIKRWPYRKLSSLQSLMKKVEATGKEEDNREILEDLAYQKRLMEENPNLVLQDETKRLRQFHFNQDRRKEPMGSLGGTGMPDLPIDDGQEGG